MFHHTYNTEAFVLGSLPAKESSRYIYLFTKEIGLIGAHAQNVRSLESKLRYALDDLSFSNISLVKGKNVWRITGATPLKRFYSIFTGKREKLILCAQILSVIRAMVTGEEKNPELFFIIQKGFEFIENGDFSNAELLNIETILMLRIMNNLGYFGVNEKLRKFVENNNWSKDFVSKMSVHRKEAISAINQALKESHL